MTDARIVGNHKRRVFNRAGKLCPTDCAAKILYLMRRIPPNEIISERSLRQRPNQLEHVAIFEPQVDEALKIAVTPFFHPPIGERRHNDRCRAHAKKLSFTYG